MKAFALAALAVISVEATPMTDYDYKFINYIAKFGKSYTTKEEYAFRLQHFISNDIEINKINDEQTSFRVAHNKFSDNTWAEYKRLLGRFSTPRSAVSPVLEPK